jgi:hypothetical protein
MMFTNTNKMIHAAAIECYIVGMIWYQQKFVYHVNKIFDDKHQKLPNRS